MSDTQANLTSPAAALKAPDAWEAQWFCLRTQPHREFFAHTFLQKLETVESFLPRIRFQGTGRRRGQWITEALFPGYIFCKFILCQQVRAVSYSPGISGLIHFGNYSPTIPFETIQQLQATFGAGEPATLNQTLKIGDRVLIESGPMQGLEGLVCRVLPGKTRVALLLEFLGQQTQIEIDTDQTHIPSDRRILWLKKEA
jgi:transcriptional antiterminator RfaH